MLFVTEPVIQSRLPAVIVGEPSIVSFCIRPDSIVTISFTDAGNVSSLMPDICANFVFTDFTVPGITSDVNLLCPENAFALISSKPSGRTIDV